MENAAIKNRREKERESIYFIYINYENEQTEQNRDRQPHLVLRSRVIFNSVMYTETELNNKLIFRLWCSVDCTLRIRS